MKKQFLIILAFFFCFHFLLPCLFYIEYGFVNLYSTVQGYTGLVINFISFLGAFLVICCLPDNKTLLESNIKHAVSFFIIAILISLYKFVSGGGYEGALMGATHGTFVSFLSLFFSLDISFYLLVCLQKNVRNVFFLILVFVLFTTATGSRSAVVGVLFLIFYLPLFSNSPIIFPKIKRILLILSIISPMIFFYGTSIRGDIDQDLLGKIIVGRISFVELSMIPLENQENGMMDKVAFDDKYSFTNQMKQVANVFSPIDPFEYDVSPNQYFRQIFLGASEQNVLDAYMSINMTLPVYFVLKTNYTLGILLTIMFLSGLYWFWVKFSSNKYVFFSVLFSLYEVLYYFDWVMIFQKVFVICLTLFCLSHYNKFLNSVSFTYKKYFAAANLLGNGNKK